MCSSSRTSASVTCRACCGVCWAAHALLPAPASTRAMSTGSGIALGYLPYLAARGVECHYIESAARVVGPSLTGRMLRRVPRVRTYTQYRHWADQHWHYGGNGFDAYEAGPCGRGRWVTGSGSWSPSARPGVPVPPADRARSRRCSHPGAGSSRPRAGRWTCCGRPGCTPVDDLPLMPTPFLPAADLASALAAADIVVSHAGTGSALANLAAGRFAVIVPAGSPQLGEAGDDHQRELARNSTRAGSPRTATPRRSPRTTCWRPGPGQCAGAAEVAFVLRRCALVTAARPMRCRGPIRRHRRRRWPRLAGPAAAEPVHLAAVDRRGVRDLRVHGASPGSRVDTAGDPVGGFAWVTVDDARGSRLARACRSRTGPTRLVPTTRSGTLLFDAADRGPGDAPFTLRCLDDSPAVADPRLRVTGEAAWHGTPLDARGRRAASPDQQRVAGATSPRRQRAGVRVEVRADLDAVRSHAPASTCGCARTSTGCSPSRWEFFERIWQEFAPDGRHASPCWRCDGDEVVAAALFLEWNGVLYYKFGASDCRSTSQVRPNDAIYWSGIWLGIDRGLGLVDWGLSDLDQPGLVAFKRKWATERAPAPHAAGPASPQPRPGQREFGDVLWRPHPAAHRADTVPDEVTARRGCPALPLLLLRIAHAARRT